MAQTLQGARNVFYAILKENEDSSAFPLTLVDSLLNSTQRNICAGNLIDLTTGKKDQIEKVALPFLLQDKFYSSVLNIYLDTAATVWWTTLSAPDTSDFASAGKLWINENIITYTGNTGTGFTWVTWILFAHLSWARVSQLFDLPTDYASSVRVIYNNQRALRNVDYRNLYLELNNYKWDYWAVNIDNYNIESVSNPFYTIIQWLYLLPFQYDVTGRMLHMIYEQKPTTMTVWTDELLIPDDYADVVPYIAAAKILYNRWEEDRALKLWSFGIWEVMSLYTYYWNQNNEDLNNQRIRTWKDAVLNI